MINLIKFSFIYAALYVYMHLMFISRIKHDNLISLKTLRLVDLKTDE